MHGWCVTSVLVERVATSTRVGATLDIFSHSPFTWISACASRRAATLFIYRQYRIPYSNAWLRPSFTHSLLFSEERRFPVYMYCQASALARGSQVFLSERISVCLSERDGQRGAARCAHGRLVL